MNQNPNHPQYPYGQNPQQPYGQAPQQPYQQAPQQPYQQAPQQPYGQPQQPYGQAPQQQPYQTPQQAAQPQQQYNPVPVQPAAPADYTQLGGVLQVVRILAIIGAVGAFLFAGIGLLTTLVGSGVSYLFKYATMYVISLLVTSLGSVGSGILLLKTSNEIGKRTGNPFDSLILSTAVTQVAAIIGSLLTAFTFYGSVGSLIFTIVYSVIGWAVVTFLVGLYVGRSQRVKVYFGRDLLKESKFAPLLKLVPDSVFYGTPTAPQGAAPAQAAPYGQAAQQPQAAPYAPTAPAAQPAPYTPVPPQAPVTPYAPVEPQAQQAPYAPVEPQVQAEPQAPVTPYAPVEPQVQPAPYAPVEPQAQPTPYAPIEPQTQATPYAPIEPQAAPQTYTAAPVQPAHDFNGANGVAGQPVADAPDFNQQPPQV